LCALDDARFSHGFLVPAVTMAGPSPSPHKPRRRTKKTGNGGDRPSRSEALVRTPAFPLAAFLWPARTSSSHWEVLPVILMVVGLFRWAAGLWGYSGE
jgi:alpha-1,3-glucosyltransferase